MDFIKEAEAALYEKKAERDYNNGNFNSALNDFIKLGELYESISQYGSAADSFKRVGECYTKAKATMKDDELKNHAKAALYYAKAAQGYLEIDEHSKAGNSFENAAKISDDLGSMDKALDYAVKAAESYANSQDSLSMSHAHLYIAEISVKMGNYSRAAENYEMAGKLDFEISDDRRGSSNYLSAAESYEKAGSMDKAISALGNAASATLRLREYSKLAEIYDRMASSYMRLNDFKNSVYYYRKGAELRMEAKDYAGAGAGYFNVGSLFEAKGDYEEALKNFLDSAKVSSEGKSYEQAAMSYEHVGLCYEKLGDPLKASEYYVYSAKSGVSAGSRKSSVLGFEKAAANFSDQAESKLLEKDFSSAGSYYDKAAECYVGMDDYSSAAESLVRKAEAILKDGNNDLAKHAYMDAAGYYSKAGDKKSSGYYFKLGGNYVKAASVYSEYAQERSESGDDFEAGVGFKFAARAYSTPGKDSERRESYNKAFFHFNKILKSQKDNPRVIADAYLNQGECYLDLSDFHKAESALKNSFDAFKESNYDNGVKLADAFLSRVKAELSMEFGRHDEALTSIRNSASLLTELINSGRFDRDYILYLKEQASFAKDLVSKIELKPEIELVVDAHAYAFTDNILVMNGVLSNSGEHTINSITFISHLPDEFDIAKLPNEIPVLKPGDSVRVSAEIKVNKHGEYVVKPFEIFYRDDENNKYVKASNESMISVDERPPEDFKNMRLAVEVYTRYAKAQFENKNFLYAGDGFKQAAVVYGKFNSDEKLREYYELAINSYRDFIESQSADSEDVLAVEKLGDAYWSIADSYDSLGEIDPAVVNYMKALSFYAKVGAKDKSAVGNAFVMELEAKKAIGLGDGVKAADLLSKSIELLSGVLNAGGLDESRIKLVEKHQSEARLLIDTVHGSPVVLLNVESPSQVSLGEEFELNVSISNPGESSLNSIKFNVKLPAEFDLIDSPSGIDELQSKSKKNILIKVEAHKSGSYRFKPLGISYVDSNDKSFMQGSNEISVDVIDGVLKQKTPDSGSGADVELTVNSPTEVSIGTPLRMSSIVENKGSIAVTGIRFLATAPSEFKLTESPGLLKKLDPGAREEFTLVFTPSLTGQFTFKPLEMFYRDSQGRRFFKSSSEVSVNVR